MAEAEPITEPAARPIDDYDPAWTAYWAENPHLLRAVGANATDGGDGGDEGSEGERDQEQGGDDGDSGADDGDNGAADANDGGGEGDTGADRKADDDGDKAPSYTDLVGSIEDENLRQYASRFDSVESVLKTAFEHRQKLSNAIIPPGKDADEKEVAAYRKAIGVPESPEEYDFGDDKDKDEETLAAESAWAKRFHDNNVPNELAQKLVEMVREDEKAAAEAQAADDKKFLEEAEADMRKRHKDDYDRVIKAGEEFLRQFGGDHELSKIELKNGQLLGSFPPFLDAIGKAGLSLNEGSFDIEVSEDKARDLNKQVDGLYEQQRKAQSAGNYDEARRLQDEIDKIHRQLGAKGSIVGADGRAA